MKPLRKARAAKEWQPHKYLVAAARKTWRWSPVRREILKDAQVKKDLWKCCSCFKNVSQVDYITKRGRKRRKIDGAVDHIIPVGKQPKTWDEYPAYYKRMFCPKDNMQFLCTACHDIKSEADRAAKKAKK